MLAHCTRLLHNTIHQTVQQVIWQYSNKSAQRFLGWPFFIYRYLQLCSQLFQMFLCQKARSSETFQLSNTEFCFLGEAWEAPFQVPSCHCVLCFCSKTYKVRNIVEIWKQTVLWYSAILEDQNLILWILWIWITFIVTFIPIHGVPTNVSDFYTDCWCTPCVHASVSLCMKVT